MSTQFVRKDPENLHVFYSSICPSRSLTDEAFFPLFFFVENIWTKEGSNFPKISSNEKSGKANKQKYTPFGQVFVRAHIIDETERQDALEYCNIVTRHRKQKEWSGSPE